MEISGFKEWLLKVESGTSTGDVAVFSRMTLPLVRRQFVANLGWEAEDPFFKKKKKKRDDD